MMGWPLLVYWRMKGSMSRPKTGKVTSSVIFFEEKNEDR
jgi:hypothetical protein